MHAITKPVLLCGPGKSGTTLLLDLMAQHPEVTWFSGWTARFPQLPQLAVLSRLNEITPLERRTRNLRRWPRPAEAYGIWDHFVPGFSQAPTDWNARHLTAEAAEQLRHVIRQHLHWQRKPRFLTKYTGWPRFGFMRELLPDCALVYIDRDPRAVVHSYERYKWWFKNQPDRLSEMSPRERVDFYATKYLAYYEAKRLAQREHHFEQITYEALVTNPKQALAELCERVQLSFPDAFGRAIDSSEIRHGTNDAWKKALSADDQRYLTARLEQPIRELGYQP